MTTFRVLLGLIAADMIVMILLSEHIPIAYKGTMPNARKLSAREVQKQLACSSDVLTDLSRTSSSSLTYQDDYVNKARSLEGNMNCSRSRP